MNRKYCLDPLVDIETKLVILGTIPGEKSLLKKCYYGNEKNHFWDIVYRTLQPEFSCFELAESKSILERYKLLLENKIGLWDVIESCERKGSSDSKIKNENLNDFTTFFKRYPNIKTVLFNGSKSEKYFRKEYKDGVFSSIKFYQLNSTSSMNSNNTFKILNEWKCQIETIGL
ncbi:DNA-deoxyinosine glycosylase [Euzebyella marina]|uniref:DNA-deoxyinosine glycosylase n=1 Tax=Euzebyella marina TaxID=1761453 RepID=A0A3G2L5C7_9FLAO|nr:DNA-deoxyinosine glycosylase [Euzebyella marina]AYN67472.1 DNA-deoxyinosine glycosylase [Euzebyella marina]